MINTKNSSQAEAKFGMATKIIASVCHKCKICPIADRKPYSAFGRIMRWHRTWYPAWAAHTKVYGRKPLS